MTPPSPAHLADQRNPVADLVAGLALAGLLLPEAIAYSSIGNVPPQAAVIALFAGLICYAAIGSSRFAIVSATSSSAAVLAAASAAIAGGDEGMRLLLCSALVLAVGGLFVLAGVAKLGAITDFIAKPVLRGFAFGLALTIVIKQLPKMTGISVKSSDLLHLSGEIIGKSGQWNLVNLALGLAALALLFLLSRIRYLPGALVVIVLGVIGSTQWNLPQYGVTEVGNIAFSVSAPAVPHLARAEWLRVGELALALALIVYAESYGSIRSFALKHGDDTSPNRDLMALGVANLASGLLQGMPVGAGYSATSANEAAGAASRLAGLACAAVLLVVVLGLLPIIAHTPEAILCAIVIHAVSHTLRPAPLLTYFRWHRDRIVLVVSILGVLVLGVVDGLLLAMAISLLMTLRRFSESRVSVLGRFGNGHDFVSVRLHPEAQPVRGMLILRPEEPLFFANAERVVNQMRTLLAAEPPATTIVILSLEESPDLDSSSLETLTDFCRSLAAQGRKVFLARMKDSAQDLLQRAEIPDMPAAATWGLSVDQAVQFALEHP